MKYWVFSILSAAIAYLFGTLNSLVVASRLVFKTNLRRIGKGSRWLPNFRRIYGVKGFAKLAAVEFIKDAFPLVIAGLLFHADGNAVVGRALAAFCLVLGRMYPSPYGFRGSYATGAIVVGALFIDVSVGLAVLAATILAAWLTKYLPLGTLAGAIVLTIAGVLVLEAQSRGGYHVQIRRTILKPQQRREEPSSRRCFLRRLLFRECLRAAGEI